MFHCRIYHDLFLFLLPVGLFFSHLQAVLTCWHERACAHLSVHLPQRVSRWLTVNVLHTVSPLTLPIVFWCISKKSAETSLHFPLNTWTSVSLNWVQCLVFNVKIPVVKHTHFECAFAGFGRCMHLRAPEPWFCHIFDVPILELQIDIVIRYVLLEETYFHSVFWDLSTLHIHCFFMLSSNHYITHHSLCIFLLVDTWAVSSFYYE